MSGQQIGTVIGGAVGAVFGGVAGAQIGMAIGGTIGGVIDPTKISGPKIGDGQTQSATDGAVIAWVQGTATVAGTIVQASKRRQIRHKDSGKGGTTQVTYTAAQDFAILVCESSELRDSAMSSVLMVIQDGKLVYDVRPGSTILDDSYKWAANVDFLFGGEDQMPHPTLEAITGVGTTPAYRGSCVAVFKNFNVSQAGDRIPNFQFVVASESTSSSPETTTIASGGVNTGGSSTVHLFSTSFSTPTIPYPPFVLFQVDPPTPERPTNAPRRAVVLDNLGRTAWDSGWVGDSSYQAALDVAIAGSAYPTLTGTLSGTPSVTSPAVFIMGAGVTGYTLDMYVGATGDTGGSGLSAICSITTVPTLPDTAAESVPLQAIAEAICKRGGLSPSDFDASALSGVDVVGYPIATQSTAADCLAPLLAAYFAFGSEYDAKLRFAFYGEDAAITIDESDLLEGNDANDGAVTSNLRNQATEYPRRMVSSYYDPAQNYKAVQVARERLATDVIAIGDQAFSIPVAMSADDAAKATDKAMKVTYATLEGTLEYSIPFGGSASYLSLACGAPLIFRGKRWVCDEVILSNGYLKLTTRYDRQSAYTSNIQAITGNAPTAPQSRYSGPTLLVPMNLPAQRPQDSVGVYITACGAAGQDNWAGCNLQVSYDDQASWVTALTMTMEATTGTIALDEPSGGEPITVDSLKYPLESATAPELAAAANVFATVAGSGSTQLSQFSTATETTDLAFELTGVSRSLGGTAASDMSAGDTFTLMDAAYFLPINQGFQGRTIYFRGVGFGEVAEDATIYSLVYLALQSVAGTPITAEDLTGLIAEDGFNGFNSEQNL